MEHLFNKKVSFIRKTKIADGLGGFTEADTTLHSDVPCRINWLSGTKKIIDLEKKKYYRDAKLYCRVLADVLKTDLVVYSGTQYEIVDVANVDEADRYLIVEIKLIT